MTDPRKFKSPEEIILGYLNFSDGVRDPQFFQAWNALFLSLGLTESANREADSQPPRLEKLREHLVRSSEELAEQNAAFSDLTRAQFVLNFLFDTVMPAYRDFHRDLLSHWSADDYCHPFLLARFCEGILATLASTEGEPCVSDTLVKATLKQLNDYLGYRPVAVLEGDRRCKPYDHEYVCAVPLWVRGAGAAVGRYQALIETALNILRETPEELRRAALFDLEQLEEIVLDPRGYDMDHPVQQRPNYLYGLWDPHKLNRRGYYCRFVLHDAHLESVLSRVAEADPADREERLFEAAAVLAGTTLMASGICGDRPGGILSTVQIDRWLQGIARLRDQFYVDLLNRCSGARRTRLEEEARQLRQPFGGTRQALNQRLSAYRSQELCAAAWAYCFARMGAIQEARRWMHRIHSGAARIRCEIRCQLSECEWLLRRGRIKESATRLAEAVDLLHRAIACGAVIDPWCILGFGGLFPIFEHTRDSIYDHRVDQLIGLMKELFQQFAALRREAAASGDLELDARIAQQARALAEWWDQFGTTAISDINSFVAHEECEASEQVAGVIHDWRQQPGQAHNLAFWREHAESLRSAISYGLLVDTLVQHGDLRAAMALLVHWASRAHEVGLGSGEISFQVIVLRWFQAFWKQEKNPHHRWDQTRKFLDFLEANAEDFFRVPKLSELLGRTERQAAALPGEEEPEGGMEDLFEAAYEGVVFRDSADDGHEGSIVDDDIPTDFGLAAVHNEIFDRCNFLSAIMLIRFDSLLGTLYQLPEDEFTGETLINWYRHSYRVQQDLLQLAEDLRRFPVPPPGTSLDSMIEFERRRNIRETLLERALHAALDIANLRFLIRAAMGDRFPTEPTVRDEWEDVYSGLLRSVLFSQPEIFEESLEKIPALINERPVLYQPITRGGSPKTYFEARVLHRSLGLLVYLASRAGWVLPALSVVSFVKSAEQSQVESGGKVSEIERLFEALAEGIMAALVAAPQNPRISAEEHRHRILENLITVAQVLADFWMALSQEIYLSTLETTPFQKQWRDLRKFIMDYGQAIFTPTFMAQANLRGVLTTGPIRWLEAAIESDEPQFQKLCDDVRPGELPLAKAGEYLRLIIESVLENYEDYLDYNSMTVQSDYGQNLYILLEFLKLKAEFLRRQWMLKPFIVAHRVLLLHEQWELAEAWENELATQFRGWDEVFLKKYERLRKMHGIHLAGLYELLKGGCLRPLQEAHIAALVRPAMRELSIGQPGQHFEQFTQRAEKLGSFHIPFGYRRPDWMEDLEQAIDRAEIDLEVLERPWEWARPAWQAGAFPVAKSDEIVKQVTDWGRAIRRGFRVLFSFPRDEE